MDGVSLADQSYQSFKNKEIRDTQSPTANGDANSFVEKTMRQINANDGVLKPNTSGWNITSSSTVNPDGSGYQHESLATTEGTRKIDGGQHQFSGLNQHMEKASHHGDDKNFVKSAAENTKTHLQESSVTGDEKSGRVEKKSSTVVSSSSKSFAQKQTVSGNINDFDIPKFDIDTGNDFPAILQRRDSNMSTQSNMSNATDFSTRANQSLKEKLAMTRKNVESRSSSSIREEESRQTYKTLSSSSTTQQQQSQQQRHYEIGGSDHLRETEKYEREHQRYQEELERRLAQELAQQNRQETKKSTTEHMTSVQQAHHQQQQQKILRQTENISRQEQQQQIREQNQKSSAINDIDERYLSQYTDNTGTTIKKSGVINKDSPPELQAQFEKLKLQPGKIVSQEVSYPKPGVKMITTKKELHDGTIVTTRDYETKGATERITDEKVTSGSTERVKVAKFNTNVDTSTIDRQFTKSIDQRSNQIRRDDTKKVDQRHIQTKDDVDHSRIRHDNYVEKIKDAVETLDLHKTMKKDLSQTMRNENISETDFVQTDHGCVLVDRNTGRPMPERYVSDICDRNEALKRQERNEEHEEYNYESKVERHRKIMQEDDFHGTHGFPSQRGPDDKQTPKAVPKDNEAFRGTHGFPSARSPDRKSSSTSTTTRERHEEYTKHHDEDFRGTHGFPSARSPSDDHSTRYQEHHDHQQHKTIKKDEVFLGTHGFPSVREPSDYAPSVTSEVSERHEKHTQETTEQAFMGTHGFPSVRPSNERPHDKYPSPTKDSSKPKHHVDVDFRGTHGFPSARSPDQKSSSTSTTTKERHEEHTKHHDEDFHGTHGFPSARSPDRKSSSTSTTTRERHEEQTKHHDEDFRGTHGFPSARTDKTDNTSQYTTISNTVKHVDAAHEAFARSLRCASPIDNARRGSNASQKSYRTNTHSVHGSVRSQDSPGRERSVLSDTSHISSGTVTKGTTSRTPTKHSTKEVYHSNETIDLPSKTVTTKTTTTKASSHDATPETYGHAPTKSPDRYPTQTGPYSTPRGPEYDTKPTKSTNRTITDKSTITSKTTTKTTRPRNESPQKYTDNDKPSTRPSSYPVRQQHPESPLDHETDTNRTQSTKTSTTQRTSTTKTKHTDQPRRETYPDSSLDYDINTGIETDLMQTSKTKSTRSSTTRTKPLDREPDKEPRSESPYDYDIDTERNTNRTQTSKASTTHTSTIKTSENRNEKESTLTRKQTKTSPSRQQPTSPGKPSSYDSPKFSRKPSPSKQSPGPASREPSPNQKPSTFPKKSTVTTTTSTTSKTSKNIDEKTKRSEIKGPQQPQRPEFEPESPASGHTTSDFEFVRTDDNQNININRYEINDNYYSESPRDKGPQSSPQQGRKYPVKTEPESPYGTSPQSSPHQTRKYPSKVEPSSPYGRSPQSSPEQTRKFPDKMTTSTSHEKSSKRFTETQKINNAIYRDTSPKRNQPDEYPRPSLEDESEPESDTEPSNKYPTSQTDDIYTQHKTYEDTQDGLISSKHIHEKTDTFSRKDKKTKQFIDNERYESEFTEINEFNLEPSPLNENLRPRSTSKDYQTEIGKITGTIPSTRKSPEKYNETEDDEYYKKIHKMTQDSTTIDDTTTTSKTIKNKNIEDYRETIDQSETVEEYETRNIELKKPLAKYPQEEEARQPFYLKHPTPDDEFQKPKPTDSERYPKDDDKPKKQYPNDLKEKTPFKRSETYEERCRQMLGITDTTETTSSRTTSKHQNTTDFIINEREHQDRIHSYRKDSSPSPIPSPRRSTSPQKPNESNNVAITVTSEENTTRKHYTERENISDVESYKTHSKSPSPTRRSKAPTRETSPSQRPNRPEVSLKTITNKKYTTTDSMKDTYSSSPYDSPYSRSPDSSPVRKPGTDSAYSRSPDSSPIRQPLRTNDRPEKGPLKPSSKDTSPTREYTSVTKKTDLKSIHRTSERVPDQTTKHITTAKITISPPSVRKAPTDKSPSPTRKTTEQTTRTKGTTSEVTRTTSSRVTDKTSPTRDRPTKPETITKKKTTNKETVTSRRGDIEIDESENLSESEIIEIETTNTTTQHSPTKKYPVKDRKDTVPITRHTQEDRDEKFTRSTSDTQFKTKRTSITKTTDSTERTKLQSPKDSPKTSRKPINEPKRDNKPDHKRPTKCLTTKTINLTATNTLLNSEDMENVIIDIQQAKSSREPSPNKIVPVPVSAATDDDHDGYPRFPDRVQEPEETRKIRNIPIFQETTNDFVGCQITEIEETDESIKSLNKKNYYKKIQIENDEKLSEMTEINKTKIIDENDKVDENCLLSVHEKVNKFINTAEEVKKPKPSSPFKRHLPEGIKQYPGDVDDECLLSVNDKVNKFLSTAEKVTKDVVTSSTKPIGRININELDETLRNDECVLSVSEKVNKFISTAERLAESVPQKSPNLVAQVDRQISKQSDDDRNVTNITNVTNVTKETETLITNGYDHDYDTPAKTGPKYPKERSPSPIKKEPTRKPSSTVKENIVSSETVTKTIKQKTGKVTDRYVPNKPKETVRPTSKPIIKTTETVRKVKSVFENGDTKTNKTTTTSKQKDILSRPSVWEAKRNKESCDVKLKDIGVKKTYKETETIHSSTKPIEDKPHRPKPATTTSITKTTDTIKSKKNIFENQTITSKNDIGSAALEVTERLTSKSVPRRKPTNESPTRKPRTEISNRKSSLDSPKKTHVKETVITSNTDKSYTIPMETHTEYSDEYTEKTTNVTRNRSPNSFSPIRDTIQTGKQNFESNTEYTDEYTNKFTESDYTRKDSNISMSKTIEKTTDFDSDVPLRHKPSNTIMDSPTRTPRKPSVIEEIVTTTTTSSTRRGDQSPTVTSRRNIFEKPEPRINDTPSSPSSRPSYMDHTKSSLEHTRRDSIEINRTNYQRKISQDEETIETNSKSAVKFGVHLKQSPTENKTRRKSSSSEIPHIEEIFDLELLEKMLTTVVGYEQRRRIRSQIRVVKKIIEQKKLEEEQIAHIRETSPARRSTPPRSPSPTVRVSSKREDITKKTREEQIDYIRESSPIKKSPVRSTSSHINRTSPPKTRHSRHDSSSNFIENESKHIEKHETVVHERSVSPQSKVKTITTITEVRKVGGTNIPEKTVTTKKVYHSSGAPTSDEKPIWATKNILKKATETHRTPKTSSTVKKTQNSTTSRTSQHHTQKEKIVSDEDVITSSYGIGPTDEDGRPLFGLRALKTKKPSETTKVTGTVVSESFYSENGQAPVGERKITVYSTDPTDIDEYETKYDSSKRSDSIKRETVKKDGITSVTRTQKIGDGLELSDKDFEPICDSTEYEGDRKVRRGSVKEISEKFIRKESSSVTEKSSSSPYPKAGLILRTKTKESPQAYSPRAGSYEDEDYESSHFSHYDSTRKESKSHLMHESESESESIKVTKKITSSSNRSFLDSSGTKVTGVDDVIERMKNADHIVKDGDTEEDREARALLNKFLGASVIMSGVESMMPSGQEIVTTKVTKINTEPVKEVVKTTRVTKTIKTEGTSSSPVSGETFDLEEIWDEEILKELLEQSTNYEERRKIRARIKQLMAQREESKVTQTTKTEEKDGAIVTTTTKVTTRTVTGSSSGPKPVSPFTKFKQLDKQNSIQSPRTSK